VGLVVATGALGKLLSKSFMLLYRVVQFAEGIAQLEATRVDLEALNPIRVVGALLGERRNGRRKFVDDGGLDQMLFGEYLKSRCYHLAQNRPKRAYILFCIGTSVFKGHAS
jgi:hypothetical protein